MSARFAELDWQQTPIGEISLRRRHDPRLDTAVYEVKLGDEYLMSSAFTVAEIELARLGLAAVDATGPLRVVVGGLGLGYTARAALGDPRVADLTVVEWLQPVIGWHRRDLLPDTVGLAADDRVRLVHGDFFALARGAGFGDGSGDGRTDEVDAVLLDVDHSPRHVLHPSHADLYTEDGLRRLGRHLRPGGVFALWSDDPPDAEFETALGQAFADAVAHVVEFANPLTGGTSSNTVYVAR